MSNIIEVLVDGIPFNRGFQEINVTTSMDHISGFFRLTTINTSNLDQFPIIEGQTCEILVNGENVINGYIDLKNVRYDADSHTIFLEGRDRTSDIIDSSVQNGDFNFSEPLQLKELIENVLRLNGIDDINVIDGIGDLEPIKDLENAGEDVAQSLMEFINRYAALRQVLLNTDGNGNILITRASEVDSGATLINSNQLGNISNILNGDVTADVTKRYNKYIVHSQDDLIFGGSGLSLPKNAVSRENDILDPRIRTSRVLSLVAEYSSDDNECKNRAIWEKNLRIAQSQVLQYQVQGFNALNGQIWKPNQLVQVQDDFGGVNDKFITRMVEFTQSINQGQGSRTKLTLVPPEAYTIQAEIKSQQIESEDNGLFF